MLGPIFLCVEKGLRFFFHFLRFFLVVVSRRGTSLDDGGASDFRECIPGVRVGGVSDGDVCKSRY